MTKWIELEDTLRLVLKKGRFEHTLGVRYTAAALAMRYDCGIEQAQLAGILHDCAKGYSGEELLKMAKKVGITVSLHSLLQGISQPRDRTQVFCMAGRFFTN